MAPTQENTSVWNWTVVQFKQVSPTFTLFPNWLKLTFVFPMFDENFSEC